MGKPAKPDSTQRIITRLETFLFPTGIHTVQRCVNGELAAVSRRRRADSSYTSSSSSASSRHGHRSSRRRDASQDRHELRRRHHDDGAQEHSRHHNDEERGYSRHRSHRTRREHSEQGEHREDRSHRRHREHGEHRHGHRQPAAVAGLHARSADQDHTHRRHRHRARRHSGAAASVPASPSPVSAYAQATSPIDPSKGLNARFANLGLNNGRDTGDARVNAPHSIDQDVRSTRPSSFASDSSWHTSPPDSPLDAPLVPPGGREILEEVSRRTGKYHATVSESIRDDGDNWI